MSLKKCKDSRLFHNYHTAHLRTRRVSLSLASPSPSHPHPSSSSYHTQVDDSGHRIWKDPAGNGVFFLVLSCRFPRTSGRKKHRKMEAVFRKELHRTWKPENPASSLYRILSGSKRDPSGKPAGNQRFPSEPGRKNSYRSRMSAKKYRFPRDADKIIQYFLGHGKKQEKSFKDLSETFLILRHF